MSLSLVLNSNNVVKNGLNSQFQYNFVVGGLDIPEGTEMCISNLTIPYSWFNIMQNYYNNATFSYTFPTATGQQTYTITLPNGNYTINEINQYMQTIFIQNSQYLVNEDGQNVYYIELLANPTYYAIQVVCYVVPSSLPQGYTNPANLSFPTQDTTPQLVVLDNNFGLIIGYTPASYPSVPETSNQSFLSNINPNASPVNSLIIRTNLVDNNVSMPSDILDSVPITAEFGYNIVYEPSFAKFVSVKSGKYSYMTLTFYDQNLNIVPARDPNCLVTLLLKYPKSNGYSK